MANSSGGGFQRPTSNTFNGDRGGSAEDAELLALLRGISNKSSSSRFADEDDDGTTNDNINNDNGDDNNNGNGESRGVSSSGIKGNGKVQQESDNANLAASSAVAENNDNDRVAEHDSHAKGEMPEEAGIGSIQKDHHASDMPKEEDAGMAMVGGGGPQFNNNLPKTFTGDRGGSAEDADLLAELRAISNKSSSDRFDGNDEEEEGGGGGATNDGLKEESTIDNENEETKKSGRIAFPPLGKGNNKANGDKNKSSRPLPPWKRKGAKIASSSTNEDGGGGVEVVIAAPPAPAAKVMNPFQNALLPDDDGVDVKGDETKESEDAVEEPKAENNLGIQSDLPKTFVGDRGGAAEDADLLAELRAISNKSSSSNRFDDDNNNNEAVTTSTGPAKDDVQEVLAKENQADDDNVVATKPKSPKKERPLPPWKRKGSKKKATMNDDDVDIVIAAPAAAVAPVTVDPFQNATLDEAGDKCGETGTTQSAHKVQDDAPTVEERREEESVGIQSNLPKTFTGDRGGAAEDANLLAELRAISNKSSSINRFEEENDATDDHNFTVVTEKQKDVVVQPESKTSQKAKEKESRPLPPWKRKGAKKKAPDNDDVDVVVAAPATLSPANVDADQNDMIDTVGKDTNLGDLAVSAMDDAPSDTTRAANEPNLGIQSNLPKTFVGDRGGSAEDADLLAELRAISNKSSSSNRFDDGDDESSNAPPVTSDSADGRKMDDIAVATEQPKSPPKKVSKERPLPPWKRKGNKKVSMNADVDVVVAAPAVAEPSPAVTAPGADESSPAAVDPFQKAGFEKEKDNGVAMPVVSNIVDAPEASAAEESIEGKTGIKSNLPNTFKGDRGGTAEDADLLAELRAISNKSSSSDRFKEDDEGMSPPPTSSSSVEEPKPKSPKATKGKQPRPLPPWKRKGSKKTTVMATDDDNMDIVVAAPPPPAAATMNPTEKDDDAGALEEGPTTTPGMGEQMEESMGIKSSLPNTFKGDRGGSAEDADLLAELRAISMKSSTDRFAGEEDETGIAGPALGEDAPKVDGPNTLDEKPWKKARDVRKDAGSKPLPPWKQKGAAKKPAANNLDVVIAAPPAPALTDEDSVDDEAFFPNVTEPDSDVLVTAPREESMGIKSNLPNTFKGDRGGSAEDADLLAELRAISMKTSSNRFDGGDEENEETNNNASTIKSNSSTEKPWKKSSKAKDNVKNSSRPLPPWKQKKAGKKLAKENDELDVVVAAPPAPSDEVNSKADNGVEGAPQDENMGIKSNLPNTFKGDRGGSAEDADLLAELRAISMKSSTDRFTGEEGNEGSGAAKEARVKSEKPVSTLGENVHDKPLPPWKRKGSNKKPVAKIDAEVVVAAPLPSDHVKSTITPIEENKGIKSNLPNTFKGDRGGQAEDADLLAELRAISMKSSTNRFTGEEDEAGATLSRHESPETRKPETSGTTRDSNSKVQGEQNNSSSVSKGLPLGTSSSIQSDSTGFAGMVPTPPPNENSEIIITLEGLDDSLKSSNWQVRKASYLFLHQRINSLSTGDSTSNLLDAGGVYPSLDTAIINALKDKNAGALDAALTLSVLYVDSCHSACSESAARDIMASLLKGTAFSSSRSSTLTSTEELVLKLIEVAPEGSTSVNDVFELMQQHGLKSKKPKVVLFSANLILKSVHLFGAGVIPLPTLKSSSASLTAHSNAKAREVGIELLAEMCRTLGSKAPLQDLVDKLKKAQQSQLDSLIEAQPSATKPSRKLRCKEGEPVSTQTPEEALAALKKSEEENEAKRLAARPAVNLFSVLPSTCYSTKIKLDKWSEKVAALDALLLAGGEQPFKLAQPSSSVNYTPLIRELRQLLGHTHFAVCSKALAALGMLGEGVGEQIFPNMRPLLPTLVGLFKDKKVINAVSSCLDKLFGNVFSFEHLLDEKDSLPSSLDEKKQKNALVRKNVLEFLSRCVKASGTYGTRGDLTIQYAEDLSKLSCEKLKDSDAATRKAATSVLLALLSNNKESIVSATKSITSTLQTTNPRAYKSLNLASTGDNKASARPQSAPAKSSANASRREPSSKRSNNVKKPASKITGLPKPPSGPSTSEEVAEDRSLPSFEESVESLSALNIAKWGDDLEDGGILAGIQSSNWKARMGALNQLAIFYKAADVQVAFDTTPYLFVLVRDCTKSFKESNFNVSKALLEIFTVIFGVHAELVKAPESYLLLPATKLSVEKIGDKKLLEKSSSCLHSICTVKDPKTVLAVAAKTVDGIKSPLVHEALLGWFSQFCIDFGAVSLTSGISDCLAWVLKECESNNMKVRKAALSVIGVMHSQLGPVLPAFIKSKDIQASISSLLDKAISDNPHDANAQVIERKMKCITLSTSKKSSQQGSSNPNALSNLSIPSTDLEALLKNDCINRINTTEGKAAWKIRRDAMEEVRVSVSKCGGLIETGGKAFLFLKQLLSALRSRLSDSQSNLKPIAATLIGSLLNHVDENSQAKLGKLVFPALVNAAANDMKKTMRDAAASALSMGTEHSEQNGGGTNILAIDSLIVCLESELTDAALKSAGLADVISLLTKRLELSESLNQISSSRQLANVIVLSLLSSKAGTRSEAEKLLSICAQKEVVSSEEFDKEIGTLKPAQQRTLRSLIPKNSTQRQEVVEASKQSSPRARQSGHPTTSKQSKPVRRRVTSSNQTMADPAPSTSETYTSEVYNDANPLHSSTSKSTKLQRLSLLGRSDNWPNYPEEPSGDATFQAIRKSWSLLISPQCIQILFPKGGIRSHEDSIRGCEMISQSIEFSRSTNDISFLEQLDLIFKWSAFALSSRDHTSGSRSLLSMLQLLFERLRDLSYVMNDAEAIIILPCIIEKAGVAKPQFREQYLTTLSFIRSNELYQLSRYGTNICMKVVEKSKSIRARSLGAMECTSCVKVIGAGAIGRKGVVTLALALNSEKLQEIRVSYLDLFYHVVQSSTLDKVLSIIGDAVSDKTKEMVIARCSKRPATAPASSGTPAVLRSEPKESTGKTPTRKSVARTTSVSPRAGKEISDQRLSSSSVATGALRSRLQRFREESQSKKESLPCTPSQKVMPPKPPSTLDLCSMLDVIEGMTNKTETLDKGSNAIHKLVLAMKKDTNGPLNASQIESLRRQIGSQPDRFISTLTGALKFAFEQSAELPSQLIQETVLAMTHFFRTPEYCSAISQNPPECCLREAVESLLDDRLESAKEKKNETIKSLVKGINRLALRVAVGLPRETALLALLSLQCSLISSPTKNKPIVATRVVWKLFNKVIREEHDTNPEDPFGSVTIDSLLYSIDWLLSTMEDIRSRTPGSDELLKHAGDSAKDVVIELLKCRGDAVREALHKSELPNDGPVNKLLVECETELGLPSHPPETVRTSNGSSEVGQVLSSSENTESRLAGLINNFAEAADGPEKQVALVALIDFKKSHNLDLEAHISQFHLSPHFKEFLLDQVGKASKENSSGLGVDPDAGISIDERMKALRLKVGQDQAADVLPVADKAASLRARLEALKQSKN